MTLPTNNGVTFESLLFYSVAYIELPKKIIGYLKIGAMGLEYIKPTDELLIGHVALIIKEEGLDSLWNFRGFEPEYRNRILKAFFIKGLDLEQLPNIKVSLDELNKVSTRDMVLPVSEVMFKESQLHTSTNYDLFKYLPFNRQVKSKHVREIIESINIFGNLSACVMVATSCITGTEEIYIADGQHRFKAQEMRGRPVYFHLTRVEDMATLIRLVAKLNSTSRRWSMRDYLNAWSSLKIKEYLIIEKQFKKTKLPFTVLLEAYSGVSRHDATQDLMDGTLVFQEIDKSNKLVENILELHSLKLAPWNRPFLQCLGKFLKEDTCDFEKMKEKLTIQKGFIFSQKVTEINKQLKEIYDN